MSAAPRSATSSTRPGPSPLPSSHNVNTRTKVLDTVSGRILCIADIRGRVSTFNDMAREAKAKAVIHTGDFGFFETDSLARINDRTLRHLTQYSPLLDDTQRSSLLSTDQEAAQLRSNIQVGHLSEFPKLLSGEIKLEVPVYTVWGACEDVVILEKFRMGTYEIDNLHVLDEATTRCLDVGGVKLRLLGLGGALVPHKMFDNGEGNATIAGGQGTMWSTILQIGELVDTAQRTFDPAETRLLVTHTSPGREGIMAQLALGLKADLTISAGLHFRYSTSYNEFSVQEDFQGFRRKLTAGKEAFDKVWESVKTQVYSVIDDNQRVLLDKALGIIEKIPSPLPAGPSTLTTDEPAWKNIWNWNLTDAAYGSLVLDIKEGRISAEIKSQGFNYAYRRVATPASRLATPNPIAQAVASGSGAPVSILAKPAQLAPPAGILSPLSPPPPIYTPPQLQISAVDGSGKATPSVATPTQSTPPKTNGNGLSDKQDKYNNKKDKKNNKKEKDGKDKEITSSTSTSSAPATTPAPTSGPKPAANLQQQQHPSRKATPVNTAFGAARSPVAGKPPTPGPHANNAHADSATPLSPASESTGGRTPTSTRPPRNPWTLFMRLPMAATEEEVRNFFQDAKSGIIRVHLRVPYNRMQSPQKTAFVEFGDEEAMKAALNKHDETIKDQPVLVAMAEDREPRDRSSSFRGRGGRARGGTFARGIAAAGLTRGQGDKRPEQQHSGNTGASSHA